MRESGVEILGLGMTNIEIRAEAEDELVKKKNNLNDFIKNLDEQHKSGLLYDDAYLELKTKYQLELHDINIKLKNIELTKSKSKK